MTYSPNFAVLMYVCIRERERERERGRESVGQKETGLIYCNSITIKPGLPLIEYSPE